MHFFLVSKLCFLHVSSELSHYRHYNLGLAGLELWHTFYDQLCKGSKRILSLASLCSWKAKLEWKFGLEFMTEKIKRVILIYFAAPHQQNYKKQVMFLQVGLKIRSTTIKYSNSTTYHYQIFKRSVMFIMYIYRLALSPEEESDIF